jgi:opacity protein-like surface antigen
VCLAGAFRVVSLVAISAFWIGGLAVPAQHKPESGYYSRVNSFGVFTAYSNDSSHILLGDAEQRRLLGFGVSYSRRLMLNHVVAWQYDGELLPVALESDPLTRTVVQQTEPTKETLTFYGGAVVSCSSTTWSYNYTTTKGVTYSGAATESCFRRQWTVGQAMSPAGMQWNFRPSHKVQPIITGHGGYMYSSQPVPVLFAGSFNFTFDVGAGLEIFRRKSKSIRAEYRYHHISNAETAGSNPGTDNGLFQVAYVFGR